MAIAERKASSQEASGFVGRQKERLNNFAHNENVVRVAQNIAGSAVVLSTAVDIRLAENPPLNFVPDPIAGKGFDVVSVPGYALLSRAAGLPPLVNAGVGVVAGSLFELGQKTNIPVISEGMFEKRDFFAYGIGAVAYLVGEYTYPRFIKPTVDTIRHAAGNAITRFKESRKNQEKRSFRLFSRLHK